MGENTVSGRAGPGWARLAGARRGRARARHGRQWRRKEDGDTVKERRYTFRLEGLSPLIMHWDNLDWADEIEAKRTAIKERDKSNFSAGDDRCPPHTWKGYAYNDGEVLVVPTDNLRTCLMKAGAKITFKNRETYKKIIPSAVLFEDLNAAFFNRGKQVRVPDIEAITGTYAEQAKAVLDLGFRLLAKRASVGQSKHVRVRPLFSDWSVEGQILVVDDTITKDCVERIFETAGLRIGLCDWRPDAPKSPGPYGRFRVTIK